MAEVVSIHIVKENKAPAGYCNQAVVYDNFGIKGDYRSGKYKVEQITLIEYEVLETVSRKLGYKIPSGASRRQIVTKGISLDELVGQRLRIGVVLVQVEKKCKPCNNMEISIGQGAKEAMNGKAGVFCRVIKGGELHINDEVITEIAGCSYCARISGYRFKFISYFVNLLGKK